MNFNELQKMMEEKRARIEQNKKMRNLDEVNDYLMRRRELLNKEEPKKKENQEEPKKQENPSKEVQIRFIKKVETDKTENKKTEQNEEEE